MEKDQSKVEALRTKVENLEQLLERHKRREKVLRAKEQVLHAAIDSAADGILAVDEGGHIILSNKQFSKMWHIPPDLIETGNDEEVIQFVLDQIKEPEAFLAKIRELYTSFHVSSDTIHFLDGLVFERDSHPMVIEEELCGRVWTFRDVTPRDA